MEKFSSLSVKLRGIEGVVVNGAVRDIDEIREMTFPVFARAVVPITGKGRIATVSSNSPIEIDSVQIHPMNFEVGDSSGIVIVPQKRVNEKKAVIKAFRT